MAVICMAKKTETDRDSKTCGEVYARVCALINHEVNDNDDIDASRLTALFQERHAMQRWSRWTNPATPRATPQKAAYKANHLRRHDG